MTKIDKLTTYCQPQAFHPNLQNARRNFLNFGLKDMGMPEMRGTINQNLWSILKMLNPVMQQAFRCLNFSRPLARATTAEQVS